MSAFNQISDDDKDSAEAFRLRIYADLSPDEHRLEALLTTKAWFPYRRLDFLERTHEFVKTFDRIYTSMIHHNSDFQPFAQQFIRNRGYITPSERLAPWVQPTKKGNRRSPRWKHWVAARRAADIRGMIYDDYVAGALVSAMRRGWARWPGPEDLVSDRLLGKFDTVIEKTIPFYVAGLYEKTIRATDDPWFRAEAFVDDPIQVAYYRHFAGELVRLYDRSQRSERAWEAYQRDGKIATCLSFSAALS
jgi:hypothetical protein